MRIIVDSNVIISSLLKNGKKFRDILYSNEYQFYSCNFLILEIFKHKETIIKYSNMPEENLLDELHKILKTINFINEQIISKKNISTAFELCKDIDKKDMIFLALTFQLNGLLWTGDKKLKMGLNKKNINIFFDYKTDEIIE